MLLRFFFLKVVSVSDQSWYEAASPYMSWEDVMKALKGNFFDPPVDTHA